MFIPRRDTDSRLSTLVGGRLVPGEHYLARFKGQRGGRSLSDQLDMVVLAATDRPGRAPGSVALRDRHGWLATEFEPAVQNARPEQPRQWLLDGWEALANAAKYLRRGSLLEAAEQLHRARLRVFRLWACAEGVDYPSFGLTSLLDTESPSLPPGIEATYPTISAASLAAAANALAFLLRSAGHHLRSTLDTPLARYVNDMLTAGIRPAG